MFRRPPLFPTSAHFPHPPPLLGRRSQNPKLLAKNTWGIPHENGSRRHGARRRIENPCFLEIPSYPGILNISEVGARGIARLCFSRRLSCEGPVGPPARSSGWRRGEAPRTPGSLRPRPRLTARPPLGAIRHRPRAAARRSRPTSRVASWRPRGASERRRARPCGGSSWRRDGPWRPGPRRRRGRPCRGPSPRSRCLWAQRMGGEGGRLFQLLPCGAAIKKYMGAGLNRGRNRP